MVLNRPIHWLKVYTFNSAKFGSYSVVSCECCQISNTYAMHWTSLLICVGWSTPQLGNILVFYAINTTTKKLTFMHSI